MKSCFFLGNAKIDYLPYRQAIKDWIFHLVDFYGVKRFFSMGYSTFDRLCAELVDEVRKEQGLSVRNTLVHVYRDERKKELSECYDDGVYLLKRRVPNEYLFLKTNYAIIKRSAMIFSGVFFPLEGELVFVLEYAMDRKKKIIKLDVEETDEEIERGKEAVYFKIFGKEME